MNIIFGLWLIAVILFFVALSLSLLVDSDNKIIDISFRVLAAIVLIPLLLVMFDIAFCIIRGKILK